MMRRLADLIDPLAPACGTPPRTLWGFIDWALRGAWPVLIGAACISALAGVVEVLAVLILGAVIDLAIDTGPQSFVSVHWPVLLAFALFFLIVRPLAFGAASAANTIVIQPNVNVLVQSRLNRWTLAQSMPFFDNDFAGRIAQKQVQAARALTEVANETVNTVAFAVASIVGSALLLLAIDWRLALTLTLWMVGYFGLIRLFLPAVRARSGARAGARATVSGQIVDSISNIKTVKLFAHADHEERAAARGLSAFRDAAIAFGRLQAGFRLSLMAFAGLLPVLLIGGSAWLWTLGQASPGDMAAAGGVAIRIAQMTGWVSFTIMTIYGELGEVEDGMRTLSVEPTLLDRHDAQPLPPVRGELRFEAVGFGYGRASSGVSGIDLRVRAGERIGIVGASGAGKSTLVALLLRLYDVEQGRVLVDGYDVRAVTQASLRRQIAMVTQETALFNRSARDNIRYGRPEAGDAEIEAAARAAEAHDFILELVDHAGRRGYDAHLGERGVRLSGGQRQRIAIARAFLKDAPVLVLDEATSALDSAVEAQIQRALSGLMAGKTVLAIAHRLSTLADMDRIIVLADGRIVEQGEHGVLLRRGGVYARFWAHQSAATGREPGTVATGQSRPLPSLTD
jgi:ATP-binding cassette, subfamily B, bacterial